ncbi:MAG: hypothetical protein K9M57_07875 [Phycisphaerae bacterium]|nr:hypothetical protein [Phycisphaerae bacterium]
MNNPSVFFSITKPAGHGGVCLEPLLGDMVASVDRNRELLLADDLCVAGESLSSWRKNCRTELLAMAGGYTGELDGKSFELFEERPLIVTGHQCQFNHCGVFVKYLLLSYLGRVKGGVALNLVVDSDIPKNTHLAVPVKGEDGLDVCLVHLGNIVDDLPMEYQSLPTADEMADFIGQLERLDVDAGLAGPIGLICRELQESYRQGGGLVDLMTRLNRQIAKTFDVDWLDLPVSLMSNSASFMGFAADMIFQPVKVWQCYNDALGDFRRHEKIKDLTHPMPDLIRGNKIIETPFWAFEAGQERQPFVVKTDQDGLSIDRTSGHGIFLNIPQTNDSTRVTPEELSKLLRKHKVELRPRALTLTIFARLFLADYFIHGIGGAYYDLVADDFIRHFYGVCPPAYGCVSATMHLPLGDVPSVSQVKETIHRLHYQLRDLHYNPQRYIANSQRTPEIDGLLGRRDNAIGQSVHLKMIRASHRDRKGNFDTIRTINAELMGATGDVANDMTRQISSAQQQLHQAAIGHDREYFFGLFQRDALNVLRRKLN